MRDLRFLLLPLLVLLTAWALHAAARLVAPALSAILLSPGGIVAALLLWRGWGRRSHR